MLTEQWLPHKAVEARGGGFSCEPNGALWHDTAPRSHCARSPVCSRPTEGEGRITLSGRRYTVAATEGGKGATEPGTADEVREAYRKRLGIKLGRV